MGPTVLTAARERARNSRPDEQYEHNGNHRGAGEYPKNDTERNIPVAEDAEAPVGQAAATDADEIHDAVAGGAQLGPHDLRQNRHIVAIEKPPAEAEEY